MMLRKTSPSGWRLQPRSVNNLNRLKPTYEQILRIPRQRFCLNDVFRFNANYLISETIYVGRRSKGRFQLPFTLPRMAKTRFSNKRFLVLLKWRIFSWLEILNVFNLQFIFEMRSQFSFLLHAIFLDPFSSIKKLCCCSLSECEALECDLICAT